MTPTRIRALLSQYGLALSKERGQNFLTDDAVARDLVARAGVQADDVVVEIGTGLGILTRCLAERAARVVTLEIDSGLVRVLEEESLLPENVALHHGDALREDWPKLIASSGATRVVANLPYAITGPLLRLLLDLATSLRGWSVMIQSDVAERLLAGPGSRTYGSLTVLHRLVARVEHGRELRPELFFPAPKVRSSFLHMCPLRDALDPPALRRVERVARAAFGQRRKTVSNALRGAGLTPADGATLAEVCTRAGIDPGWRAERIAPEGFLALSRALDDAGKSAR